MFVYPVTLKRDKEGGYVVTFKLPEQKITQGAVKNRKKKAH